MQCLELACVLLGMSVGGSLAVTLTMVLAWSVTQLQLYKMYHPAVFIGHST